MLSRRRKKRRYFISYQSQRTKNLNGSLKLVGRRLTDTDTDTDTSCLLRTFEVCKKTYMKTIPTIVPKTVTAKTPIDKQNNEKQQ